MNLIKEKLLKIEALIHKQLKCNLNSVTKYQEDLQKAFADIECLDANLKLLDKLMGRLDSPNNPVIQINKLSEGVKNAENKLIQIKQIMPDFLKNLSKMCSQITSIEEVIQQIEGWIEEGDSLLKSDPDQLTFEQIVKHIEKQKVWIKFYKLYNKNSLKIFLICFIRNILAIIHIMKILFQIRYKIFKV